MSFKTDVTAYDEDCYYHALEKKDSFHAVITVEIS